jgi:hypothetical protein
MPVPRPYLAGWRDRDEAKSYPQGALNPDYALSQPTLQLADKGLLRVGQSACEECFHAGFGSRSDAGDDVA